MAEKKRQSKKMKKVVTIKHKSTMRESAAKSRAEAKKPKKVRRAAVAATKPVGSFFGSLNQEFHLFEQKNGGSFFTKTRRLTPKYFRDAYKEVRMVEWPGRKETWRLVFAVFVFSIITGLVIVVLDFGLEKILRKIIL